MALGGLAILGPVLILQANVLLQAVPEERRKGLLKPIQNLDRAFGKTVVSFLISLLAGVLVNLLSDWFS
jgi:hypothetical protein